MVPDERRKAVRLVQKTTPHVAALVAQGDPESVGDSGNRLAVRASKAKVNGVIGLPLGRTSPGIAEFISDLDILALSETVQGSTACFEAIETVWYPAMAPAPAEKHLQFKNNTPEGRMRPGESTTLSPQAP